MVAASASASPLSVLQVRHQEAAVLALRLRCVRREQPRLSVGWYRRRRRIPLRLPLRLPTISRLWTQMIQPSRLTLYLRKLRLLLNRLNFTLLQLKGAP